jgi:hypothetical protein
MSARQYWHYCTASGLGLFVFQSITITRFPHDMPWVLAPRVTDISTVQQTNALPNYHNVC